MPRKLRIDLFADIACPWCYIGEARLEKALAQRPDLEVEWYWHPFQLQPELPKEGRPWKEFAEEHFGGEEQAARLQKNMTAAASVEGLDFRFDLMPKAPNTREAHRVILFGEERGHAREAASGLFHAYFTEGADITDEEVLLNVGTAAGYDRDELTEYFRSEAGNEDVDDSLEVAGRIGIDGVPFFIFGNRYTIHGAQPVETFVEAIDAAMK